jgi:hypothetical protein
MDQGVSRGVSLSVAGVNDVITALIGAPVLPQLDQPTLLELGV